MTVWWTMTLACVPSAPDVASPPPAPPPAAAPAPAPEPPPPPPEPTIVTLAAVGDVLPHRAVKATARDLGWAHVFGETIPILQGADLAFANLESPVAPDADKGVYDEVFNAPADLPAGLAAAGMDVVAIANNHAWDQGVDGLLETLGRVRDAGLASVGAGPDCAAARAPWIAEVRGLRIAFLAATDLINFDLNAAEDAPCVFVAGPECTADCGPDRDAIHFSLDAARLVAAVQAARPRADFVVMSFHWGNEYRTVPLPEYPKLARVLVEAGVDVVLGGHPHMLQRVERIEAGGRSGVAIYSLGNFVSNMAASYDPATDRPSRGNTRDGGILRVDLVREIGGATRLGEVRLIPVWTENNLVRRAEGEPHRVRVTPLANLAERAEAEADTWLRDLAALRLETLTPVVGAAWLDLPADPSGD